MNMYHRPLLCMVFLGCMALATPSGTFKVQLASETAATNVTIKAGSYIRYRVLP